MQTGDVVSIFGWFIVAAVASVVGFLIAVAVRRWAQREERGGSATSFTFQDLRDMRARGDITEQEFAAMRAALLAQWDADQTSAEPPASREAPPEEPPER